MLNVEAARVCVFSFSNLSDLENKGEHRDGSFVH